MEKTGRKIIKEKTAKGLTIFRYNDFNEKIDEQDAEFENIGWRFSLIMERFKLYLDTLESGEEATRIGIVLGAVIKDAENELDDIADFINESLGGIGIIYKEDLRYANYQSRSVAGIVFKPSSAIR